MLVTGAAHGLGAAVAGAVRAAGGRPVGLDRAPVADIEHEVVDLADTRAAEDAVRQLIDRVGGLDAVVTAAGTDTPVGLGNLPGPQSDRIVTVNLLGTAAVVRAALPSLLARSVTVVTVASTLGIKAVGDATAYCASKFGVVGFTRAQAAETRGQTDVTLLIPGGMQSAFFDGRDEQYRPPPDAQSRYSSSRSARHGCRSFASVLDSICRMRSRVTPNSWPTTSSVRGWPSQRPYRSRMTRCSRSVRQCKMASSCSCSSKNEAASIGTTASESSMKVPRLASSSPPIGVSNDTGS